MKRLLLTLAFVLTFTSLSLSQSQIQDQYVDQFQKQFTTVPPGLPPFPNAYVYLAPTNLLVCILWNGDSCLTIGGIIGNTGVPLPITNCTAAGTVANETVQLSSQTVNGLSQLCATVGAVNSTSIIGICLPGNGFVCGNTGTANVLPNNFADCVMDNSTVQNDYVIPSATNAGFCSDSGISSSGTQLPSNTTETLGIVATPNSGGSGTLSQLILNPLSLLARGGTGSPGSISPCSVANCNAYMPNANTPGVSGDPNVIDNPSGFMTMFGLSLNDSTQSGFYYTQAGPALPSLTALNAFYFSVNPAFGTTYGLEPFDTAPTAGDCVSIVAGDAANWFKLHDTGAACGAGSGSVTSFSSGDLSPLFTTTVATPTTTPALSFTLSSAAANTVFGNFTGSSHTPSFNAVSTCGDSTHALAWTSGTGFTCQSITAGGGTVTSVGLTVNGTSPSGIFTVTGSPVTSTGTLNFNLSGTSGGIPYFSTTTVLSSSALLGANLPVFGGGTGTAPFTGTRSGNTTEVATVTGSTPSGDCVKWDASGNAVDAGAPCGTGGGSVTSITATSPIVVTPSPITSTGVVSCPTCTTGFSTGTLSTPSAPVLTTNGSAGSTHYTYGVVGCQDTGCLYHTPLSTTTQITTGNATLSSSNSINLKTYGDTFYGVRGYVICRTAAAGTPSTTGIITGNLASPTLAGKIFVDTGLAGDGTNCATQFAANTTVTTPFCQIGSSLPGAGLTTPGFPCGVDGMPLTPNAFDDEMMQNFGAPGDVNNTVWAWGNQHSATASWSNGTIILVPDGTNEWEYLTNAVALPTAPYAFTIFVSAQVEAATSTTGNGCFIGFRESGTSKILTISILSTQAHNSQTGNGAYLLDTRNSTSNTPGAGLEFQSFNLNQGYLRIQNNGASPAHTITFFSPSGDGIGYTKQLDQTITTPFTTAPNQLIIGGIGGGGGNVTCTFDFERRTQ